MRKGRTVLAKIVIVIAHDLYKGFDDFRANIYTLTSMIQYGQKR